MLDDLCAELQTERSFYDDMEAINGDFEVIFNDMQRVISNYDSSSSDVG